MKSGRFFLLIIAWFLFAANVSFAQTGSTGFGLYGGGGGGGVGAVGGGAPAGTGFGLYGPYMTRPYVTPPYAGYGNIYSPVYRYGLNTPLNNPSYLQRYYTPYTANLFYRPPVELYGLNNPSQSQQTTNFVNPSLYQTYYYGYPAYRTPVFSYRSYYPSFPVIAGNQSTKKESDATTSIKVLVPKTDAQLWFNGVKTKQTGKVREFVTPSLEAGYKYRYRIRATWTADGENHQEDRTVQIQPGQQLTLDLTKK